MRVALLAGGLALTICGHISPPVAASERWLTDFEKAREKAAAAKKDLLVNFTGSDWCHWCVRLEKEVFAQAAFETEALKHFVLVELDYPRRKELPEKIKKQNEALKKRFGIEMYPTVYLLDAAGRSYGATGYLEGGPKAFLEQLAKLRRKRETRDGLLAKAAGTEGLARAGLLDRALAAVEGEEELVGYDDLVAEIIQLDGDNSAGLRIKYLRRDVERTLRSGDIDGALRRIDAMLESVPATGAAKQTAYYLKALALNQREDIAGTVTALKAALDADRESDMAKTIAALIRALEDED